MPLGTHYVYLGNMTTWQRREKLAESAAKSTHPPNQPDAMQHAWAHEQQRTLSCHNRRLRAHLKLMLYSDVPLQSTSIKGEATLYSAQHEGRNGENGEKERGRGGEENQEMEAKPERRRRQDEESLAWPLLFMPLQEQGPALCPMCWFRANRGWDSR